MRNTSTAVRYCWDTISAFGLTMEEMALVTTWLISLAHPRVYAGLFGPEQLFLHCRPESHNVETADERRVEIGELVLVTFVHRGDDAASLGKALSGELAV